jgi:hypothetical protein
MIRSLTVALRRPQCAEMLSWVSTRCEHPGITTGCEDRALESRSFLRFSSICCATFWQSSCCILLGPRASLLSTPCENTIILASTVLDMIPAFAYGAVFRRPSTRAVIWRSPVSGWYQEQARIALSRRPQG